MEHTTERVPEEDVPEPGRWRGRVTPKQNAVLIGLMVVTLIGVVAGLFRLRFERMDREESRAQQD